MTDLRIIKRLLIFWLGGGRGGLAEFLEERDGGNGRRRIVGLIRRCVLGFLRTRSTNMNPCNRDGHNTCDNTLGVGSGDDAQGENVVGDYGSISLQMQQINNGDKNYDSNDDSS